MWVQEISTNTFDPGQLTYRGWTYQVGAGTPSISLTLTLPNGGFDSASYDLSVYIIGTKDGANPTSRGDVDAAYPHNLTVFSTAAVTSTTFQVRIADVDATNIAVTRRVLISWIAIGPKASG